MIAQNKTIDSLKLLLNNAKHDTTRCNILNLMAENESDEKIWPQYNEQLKNTAEQNLKNKSINTTLRVCYLKHLAGALNNCGVLFQNHGDINKAIDCFSRSLVISEGIKDKKTIAYSLNNIACAYVSQGLIPKALEYCIKGIKIKEELGDKKGLASALSNVACIYKNRGDVLNALEYFTKSLKIYQDLNDKEGTARELYNIGFIYKGQGDIKKALDYSYKSLNIQKEINDKRGMAYSLLNIGNIYKEQDSITQALKYCTESLKFQEETQNKEGIALTINNIGNVYSQANNLTKALEYYKKSLAVREKGLTSRLGLANTLNNIANVLFRQNQLTQAQNYAEKSLAITKELGYPDEIKITSRLLYRIYKQQNKAVKALEMYEQYIVMRDSISNDENRKATYRQDIKYEYEQKEALLKAEQEKREAIQQDEIKQQKLKINVAIVVIVIILISVFFIFRIYKQKRKAVHQVDIIKKVSEVELKALRAQMNPHFVFNSLNTIQNFIANKDYQSAMYYLGSFSSLLRMILQNSFKKLIPLEQELNFLKTYTDLEKMRFDNKFQINITVKESIEALAVHVPPMIIQPIIENAFKHGLMHRTEGGILNIAFDCSPNKEQLICVVEDNGIGRTKSQEIENWRPIDHQSKGIEITESRIEMLNLNRIKNLYSIKLFDLYDSNSVACGTKVEIKFPIN